MFLVLSICSYCESIAPKITFEVLLAIKIMTYLPVVISLSLLAVSENFVRLENSNILLQLPTNHDCFSSSKIF